MPAEAWVLEKAERAAAAEQVKPFIDLNLQENRTLDGHLPVRKGRHSEVQQRVLPVPLPHQYKRAWAFFVAADLRTFPDLLTKSLSSTTREGQEYIFSSGCSW